MLDWWQDMLSHKLDSAGRTRPKSSGAPWIHWKWKWEAPSNGKTWKVFGWTRLLRQPYRIFSLLGFGLLRISWKCVTAMWLWCLLFRGLFKPFLVKKCQVLIKLTLLYPCCSPDCFWRCNKRYGTSYAPKSLTGRRSGKLCGKFIITFICPIFEFWPIEMFCRWTVFYSHFSLV